MADRAKEARLQKEVVFQFLQELARVRAKDGDYWIWVDSRQVAYASISDGKLVSVKDDRGQQGWQTVVVKYPINFDFISVVHKEK